MTSTQAPVIKFAPGVLDSMAADYTPEEMQQLLNEIAELNANGTLMDESVDVDMDALMRDDPELYLAITQAIDAADAAEAPTLQ